MKRSNSRIFKCLGLICFIALWSPNFAFAECPQTINGPRVDLMLPTGCVLQDIFKRQLADQNELRRPKKETPLDAGRRTKILTDWRAGNTSKSTTPEAGK